MKTILAWLGDPSLHMILLSLVLAYCAIGNLAEESIEAASSPLPCPFCGCSVQTHVHHVPVVASVDQDSRSE